MNDIHLLNLMLQLGLDIQKDIHYLYVIENFIHRMEERKTGWVFRVTPEGNSALHSNRNSFLDE